MNPTLFSSMMLVQLGCVGRCQLYSSRSARNGCTRSSSLGEERQGLFKKVTKNEGAKTYNTGDSPVVTDLSTSPAVSGLSKGERTGPRAFHCVWSYVVVSPDKVPYLARYYTVFLGNLGYDPSGRA
ncbi:hypothetical protein VTK56DRAFT_1086 [Thermocarpiscus australiensis]